MLPQYAAPEIFDRQATYTQAVDMWSLGVSLYAMSVIITQVSKDQEIHPDQQDTTSSTTGSLDDCPLMWRRTAASTRSSSR